MLKISLIESAKPRSYAGSCQGELLAEIIPERWMIDRNAHLIGAAEKETFSALAVLTPTKGQHISERFSLSIGEATDTSGDFKGARLRKFGNPDA